MTEKDKKKRTATLRLFLFSSHSEWRADGSTSTMEALTVAVGRTGKPTDTASARDPRVKASTPDPGPTVSRSSGSTPGPAGICTRATGRRANATGWVLRPRGSGFIVGSGVTGSRVAMEFGRAPIHLLDTMGRGVMDYRMAMVSKPMGMVVSATANVICLFRDENRKQLNHYESSYRCNINDYFSTFEK